MGIPWDPTGIPLGSYIYTSIYTIVLPVVPVLSMYVYVSNYESFTIPAGIVRS